MKYLTKLPFEGIFNITYPFGAKDSRISNRIHDGIDMVGKNTNVYSIVSGIVSYVGFENLNNKKQGFGLYVSIKFDENTNGYKKAFLAHLSSTNVKIGDKVTPATIIGKMGSTGNVTGPHTHVEIREYDKNNQIVKIINAAEFMGIDNKIGIYDSKNYREYINENKYTIGRYKVNTPSGVNVRTGPGTNYRIKALDELTADAKKYGGYINGTIFDVFEISSNWGRTPSGWVCLDYAVKIN